MNTTLKSTLTALAVTVLFSTGALGVSKTITVMASVDPSMDMTMADGTPLPASVQMSYIPGTGLAPLTKQVSILTNDGTADTEVSLSYPLELTDGTAPKVPMSVTLAGKAIASTGAVTTFTPADLGLGQGKTKSVPLELKITQTTPSVLAASANYTGNLGLLVVQKP